MYTCDLTNPIPSTWSIPHLPSECLTLCGRGGQGLYEDEGEYGVNMAFIGPTPLLQACLGATHSSQASPAKEAAKAPPVRPSSSSCVVRDSLHLFFWSKRADISHVRSEGLCVGGRWWLSKPSPTLDGAAVFCLPVPDGVPHTVILGQSALLYHHGCVFPASMDTGSGQGAHNMQVSELDGLSP